MEYRIETATIDDMKELLELQKRAFKPVAETLKCEEIPQMMDTLENCIAEFGKDTILKMLSDDNKIIGSVRGNVNDGSLYIGRLMIDPKYQGKGLGRKLQRKLESMFDYKREWLCSYINDTNTYNFYKRDGFVEYDKYEVVNGVMAAHMEKK
ncbi:MAG: GNAT family N-acetyltransferase [Bacteroidales bacterium]|nr:GNAT family N-acetyltransferase [Bacteroidales bacterium]